MLTSSNLGIGLFLGDQPLGGITLNIPTSGFSLSTSETKSEKGRLNASLEGLKVGQVLCPPPTMPLFGCNLKTLDFVWVGGWAGGCGRVQN